MFASPASRDPCGETEGASAGVSADAIRAARSWTARTPSSYPPAGTCAIRMSRCRQWSNTTARSITSSPIGGHGASSGSGAGCPSRRFAASYARYPIRPPIRGGRSASLGPASERAIAISASRGSASADRAIVGSGRTICSIRTPSPSTTTVAAGSPGHERVPAPPLRALDGLQDQAGAVARQRREQPDGRGDVGEQLRPHGNQRPLGRERVELVTTGPHLQMRFHVRSFWSVPPDPCACRTARERRNPGPSARGCGGSRCERGTYGRAGMRLREPRRHVQVIPCIRIRRRLCLLSNGGVNDGDGRAAILWNPCASPDRSCRRCVKIRRKQRSRVIVSCSAAGSCGR